MSFRNPTADRLPYNPRRIAANDSPPPAGFDPLTAGKGFDSKYLSEWHRDLNRKRAAKRITSEWIDPDDVRAEELKIQIARLTASVEGEVKPPKSVVRRIGALKQRLTVLNKRRTG